MKCGDFVFMAIKVSMSQNIKVNLHLFQKRGAENICVGNGIDFFKPIQHLSIQLTILKTIRKTHEEFPRIS